MEEFLLSFGLIFVAELGDKTQLVALTLATRFKAGVVLAGIFIATLLVHLLSVGIGGITGTFLSAGWIELLSGLAFIGFGLWTIRGDELDEDQGTRHSLTSPLLIVIITFFLAELGDKTMLGTVTLAASYSLVWAWIGSTLGMVLSDGIAIWVGQALGKKLPERAIKIGAAAIFFAFGLYYVMAGANELWQVLPGLEAFWGQSRGLAQ